MPITPSITSVSSSASSVTILANNAARRGATIQNTSTAILYLRLDGATATATTGHSVQVAPNTRYEIPTFNAANERDAVYTGVITGIWASANGQANITEWLG